MKVRDRVEELKALFREWVELIKVAAPLNLTLRQHFIAMRMGLRCTVRGVNPDDLESLLRNWSLWMTRDRKSRRIRLGVLA